MMALQDDLCNVALDPESLQNRQGLSKSGKKEESSSSIAADNCQCTVDDAPSPSLTATTATSTSTASSDETDDAVDIAESIKEATPPLSLISPSPRPFLPRHETMDSIQSVISTTITLPPTSPPSRFSPPLTFRRAASTMSNYSRTSSTRVVFAPSVRIASRPAPSPRMSGRGGAGAKRIMSRPVVEETEVDHNRSSSGNEVSSKIADEHRAAASSGGPLAKGGVFLSTALKKVWYRTAFGRRQQARSITPVEAAPTITSTESSLVEEQDDGLGARQPGSAPTSSCLPESLGGDVTPADLRNLSPALPEDLPPPPGSFIPGTLIMSRWKDGEGESAGEKSTSSSVHDVEDTVDEAEPLRPETLVSTADEYLPEQDAISIASDADNDSAARPKEMPEVSEPAEEHATPVHPHLLATDPSLLVLWDGEAPADPPRGRKRNMPLRLAACLRRRLLAAAQARSPPEDQYVVAHRRSLDLQERKHYWTWREDDDVWRESRAVRAQRVVDRVLYGRPPDSSEDDSSESNSRPPHGLDSTSRGTKDEEASDRQTMPGRRRPATAPICYRPRSFQSDAPVSCTQCLRSSRALRPGRKGSATRDDKAKLRRHKPNISVRIVVSSPHLLPIDGGLVEDDTPFQSSAVLNSSPESLFDGTSSFDNSAKKRRSLSLSRRGRPTSPRSARPSPVRRWSVPVSLSPDRATSPETSSLGRPHTSHHPSRPTLISRPTTAFRKTGTGTVKVGLHLQMIRAASVPPPSSILVPREERCRLEARRTIFEEPEDDVGSQRRGRDRRVNDRTQTQSRSTSRSRSANTSKGEIQEASRGAAE